MRAKLLRAQDQVLLFNNRERLRGESFIKFDKIGNIGQIQTGQFESFGDGKKGADAHIFRFDTAGGKGDKARQWLEAEAGCFFCRHNYGCGSAVRHLRRVTGCNCAIYFEGRFSLARASPGSIFAWSFIGINNNFTALFFAFGIKAIMYDSERDNLSFEFTGFDCGNRFLVAAH